MRVPKCLFRISVLVIFVVLCTLVLKESNGVNLKPYTTDRLVTGYGYIGTEYTLKGDEMIVKTRYKKLDKKIVGSIVELAVPTVQKRIKPENISHYSWGDDSKGEITLF